MTTETLSVLIASGVLALLAALVIAVPLWRRRDQGRAGIRLLAAGSLILLPLLAISLYNSISTYPWQDPQQLAQPTEGPSVNEVNAVLQELEQSMEQTPSVEGWVLLGQSYVSLQRFPEAINAWQNAWELSDGEVPQINISYAEALVLSDRETLLGRAGELLDSALQVIPEDPRALWYGGLSAQARGDLALAGDRWSRLLNNPELPPQLRGVLQQELAALGIDSGTDTDMAQQPDGTTVEVSVSIDPALEDRLQGSETLFLIAREAGQAGPPVAVRRVQAAELPLTLRLTAADVMLNTSSLSSIRQLQLIARLSTSGDAAASPGDLYGEWRASAEEPSELQLYRVVIDRIQD